MAVADDGTVTPVASPDAAGAYPLAYVEHAVAPTEPLVTADCAPRPDSQALLTGWLEHLVGDGQEDFDGLVPLPPTLVEVAEESIDRIGTADATGTCGPKVEPPVEPPAVTPPGSLPGGVPGGIPGGIPGLGGSGIPAGRRRPRWDRPRRGRRRAPRVDTRGRRGRPRRLGRATRRCPTCPGCSASAPSAAAPGSPASSPSP